jgi:beta-galactosidase
MNSKLFKILYSFAFYFSFAFVANYAQNSANEIRSKININSDWNYLENNSENRNEIRNASGWIAISLPHSWNSQDATDTNPGYRRSASWYKKSLSISNVDSNKVYQLYFEGSNISTKVYVNGKEAGGHIGGYIGFTIDITKYITAGNNEVLVRVDNSYTIDIIPSQKSDFFIYGGITRDVWLLTIAKNHIDNIKITTPKVSQKSASLAVEASVNSMDSSAEFSYSAQLIHPKGKVVSTKKGVLSGLTTTIAFNDIKNPDLWDIDKPNLYTVTVSLIEKGTIIDKIEDKQLADAFNVVIESWKDSIIYLFVCFCVFFASGVEVFARKKSPKNKIEKFEYRLGCPSLFQKI